MNHPAYWVCAICLIRQFFVRTPKLFSQKTDKHPTQWTIGLADLTQYLIIVSILISNSVSAQTIPDTTLGSESSRVTRGVAVPGGVGDRIEGGAQRGTSLFHSFQELNVPIGERLYFANPANVQRIFSRVTGQNLSTIRGTLGVEGQADLFLINPNGILFGSTAQLDIRGSFFASTASALLFANQGEFSAVNPQTPPLLTIDVPFGLQYGDLSSASIINEGNLTTGQDLTLSADFLNLQGQLQAGRNLTLQARNALTIRDSATVPWVVRSGGQLLLQSDQSIDISALAHADSGFFSGGDLLIRSPQSVLGDARFWSSGKFRIEQLNGRLGGFVSLADPIIRAVGDVEFETYTGNSLHILAGGSVTIPGLIRILAADIVEGLSEEVILSNGASLQVNGRQEPTLDIRAGVRPTAIEMPNSMTPSLSIASPTRADIQIGSVLFGEAGPTFAAAGQLFLTNQYQPNETLPGNITTRLISNSSGDGGGAIVMDSRGDLRLNDTIFTTGAVSAAAAGDRIYSGNGGDVTLIAANDIILASASENVPFATPTSILSTGRQAGTVTLISGGAIVVSGGLIYTSNTATDPNATGGDILITANQLQLTEGSILYTEAIQQSNAGNITIRVADQILVDGSNARFETSGIVNLLGDGGKGRGGDIAIQTGSLVVQNGARVGTATLGQGNAGDITVQANGHVRLQGVGNAATLVGLGSINLPSAIQSTVDPLATGNSGNIRLSAQSLSILDGAQLLASTAGRGNAGTITLNVADTVRLTGTGQITVNGARIADLSSTITSQVLPGAIGDGGNIRLTTGSLVMANNAILDNTTTGQGNAGNITVRADDVRLSQSFLGSNVGAGGNGAGGNVVIQTDRLRLTNGAQIGAALGRSNGNQAGGQGQGGSLRINAADSVLITGTRSTTTSLFNPFNQSVALQQGGVSSGLFVSSERGASGAAGTIRVTTDRFYLTNGAVIEAFTANDSPGGNVTINANTFRTTRGGQILTTTFDSGDAGDIVLNVADRIQFAGADLTYADRLAEFGSEVVTNVGANSGLFANVESSATGNGGTIILRTDYLSLRNQAQLSAATLGQGRAGDIVIQAADAVTLDNSSVTTDVQSGASGQGGSITFQVDRLSLRQAQVQADTAGQADAGNIRIRARDGVALAQQSQVSTRSRGAGEGAGEISIRASTVGLTGESQIVADTESGDGGNIALADSNLLFLRQGSRISTDAGTAQSGGDGGNIAIGADLIVAVPTENSDIRANAFTGQGGQVNITTEGLFGIQTQVQPTVESGITASSARGVQGEVAIENQDVDPRRGLAELPTIPVDVARLIDRNVCQLSRGSEFVVTGRGGLPFTPSDALQGETVWEDWRLAEVDEGEIEQGRSTVVNNGGERGLQAIVEAQGWVVDEQGRVVLVADGFAAAIDHRRTSCP